MVKTGTFGDFTQALKNAGIIDPDYPTKGGYVWLPDGFEYKENVFRTLEGIIKKRGYQRYQFPRLIPRTAIEKVTASIDDFERGIFWLADREGNSHNLFLNPTGECGVYTMFNKWVRTEQDLPLRTYQIGTTFRPHKRSDAMLNGDELTNLLEAHSAFSSKKGADDEFLSLITDLEEVHQRMGIPHLVLRRPLVGNKPVCTDMVSFETYLPSKRSSFNVGVLYNQGQIYSKAFNVKFSSASGKEHTHQVTFGISERGVAAMLDLHKDDFGLRLLPEFAPTQISIIPVYGGAGSVDDVNQYARAVQDVLSEYRTQIDWSKGSPGKKLAKARNNGVPIRLTIDSRDVNENSVRVYLQRDGPFISGVGLKTLVESMGGFMESVREDIRSVSEGYFQTRIANTHSLGETEEAIRANLIAKIHYCGDAACLQTLNSKLTGEMIGTNIKTNEEGPCLSCGKGVQSPSYHARRGSSP